MEVSLVEWEYKSLRDEIVRNQQQSVQILTMCVTATGAILGFAVNNSNPFLALIPLAILIPGAYMHISAFEKISRLTSYIRLFIEPLHKDIRYHTRLSDSNDWNQSIFRKWSKRIFTVLDWFCIILSAYLVLSNPEMTNYILLMMMAVLPYLVFHHKKAEDLMRDTVSKKAQEYYWKVSNKKERLQYEQAHSGTKLIKILKNNLG